MSSLQANALPVRAANFRLAALLAVCAIIASFIFFPYLVMTMARPLAAFNQPFWLISIRMALQNGLMCLLLGWLGLAAGARYGLDAPWLRAFVYRQPVSSAARAQWGMAAGLGVLVGALVAVLSSFDSGLVVPVAGYSQIDQIWRGSLTSIYAASVDDLLSFVFLFSVIVWVLAWFNRRQASSWMYWIAILVAALSVGAAHFPAASGLGLVVTPVRMAWIMVLNGIGGLLIGFLFWKRGLEHAMLAQFSASLVLHVASPLIFIVL